jgi:hypothetical protein
MITTEDIFLHDLCPRLQLYSAFEPPRITLSAALNEALQVGLLRGKPEAAANHIMARAANPGLALAGVDVYKIAVHHAHLIEVVVTYLLGEGKAWELADPVSFDRFEYQPMSYKIPGENRLRRVVLCGRFDETRKQEEIHSWRSVADIALTGMPMLINAIVIGSAIKGMRANVWTRSYEHPRTKGLRIKITEEPGRNKEFNQNWRRMFREQSGKSPKQWLHLMQKDDAFKEVVFSFSADLEQTERISVESQMKAMNLGDDTMRRNACFSLSPCVMAPCCYGGVTPAQAGWVTKVEAALP